MKNIIDAVNEFKGESPEFDYVIAEHIEGGTLHLFSTPPKTTHIITPPFRRVCDRAKFIACVRELSKAKWMQKHLTNTITEIKTNNQLLIYKYLDAFRELKQINGLGYVLQYTFTGCDSYVFIFKGSN